MPIPFPGTALQTILREKGHLMSEDYDEYYLGCCVVRTDAMTSEEIVYHWQKMAARRNVKLIPTRFSKYYVLNVLQEALKNPASLLRRLKTFLNVMKAARRR